MKKSFLVLLLLSALPFCFSQKTTYKLNYFSPKDYGRGHEATNLACVQDLNGVLYFGNAGGLLQYDGVSWSFIPVKNQSLWIQAIAVNEKNVIFLGAQNEFGYLAPDRSGRLSYMSLSDLIPENQKSFFKLQRVWTAKNLVVFQYEEAIFLYSNNKLTKILPKTSFHVSFLVNNELYVRQRDIGIMRLTGDSLQLVKGSEFLKDQAILSMFESSENGKYIIITHEGKFWSIDKNSFEGSGIITADSSLLEQSEIYGALKLKDGKIALNTLSNGIIIIDETFRIQTIINKNNGLKVNGVTSLLQDYQGNIWASLDNGIVQLNYASPISIFGSESGISGNINSIVRYNGILYIGTTSGLFVQNNDFRNLSSFVPVDGISKEIKSLSIAYGCLLAGTRDELFEIKNNKISKIESLELKSLYYSEKLKLLFISCTNKFIIYRYSKGWIKWKEIPEISAEVERFEEINNKENTIIWLGTASQGIIRVNFSNKFEYKVDKYNSGDGLNDNSWVLPYKIDNQIIFSQRDGLMSFIDEKTVRNMTKIDSLKYKTDDFYKGYFEPYIIDSLKAHLNKPFYVIQDTKDRIYVNLDGDLGYFDKSNSFLFVTWPFCLADIGKINVFFHENNGICWIGGNDGLLKFNENSPKDYSLDFNTLITRFSCGKTDSVIYEGYSYKISHVQSLSKKNKFVLNHRFNNVKISFAAPFFEGQEKTLYSYSLNGLDSTFSQWSSNSSAIFRYLKGKEYTFRVRAMNVYDHVSSENAVEFRVLSPWYLTIWAYAIYVSLLMYLIYLLIQFNTRRLIALNKKLENIIQKRTFEIHEKNIELQRQKEEIVDSINYAQRIQNALLPDEGLINNLFGDHFIIYRPKDIVSGDFYWVTIYNQHVFFCVADCTGHGVPGAFMSMMCISQLNEIIIKDKLIHPDEILNKVRVMVIESLKQKGVIGEQKDGMDISMCVYDKENSIIEFAGANNPFYIIRKKNKEILTSHKQVENTSYILYEFKGDRMPIAIYDKMEPFRRQTVNVLKDDRLYLFSDGICDQFGGPYSKKFTNNSLKAALLETLTHEIADQGNQIENIIDVWQAYINPKTGFPYEQIDDICLIGIKI